MNKQIKWDFSINSFSFSSSSCFRKVGGVGDEERHVRQEVEDPRTVKYADALVNEASEITSQTTQPHLLLSLLVGENVQGHHLFLTKRLPISFVHFDLERSGLFLDLVPIGRQRGSVEVIYFSYGSQGYELNDNVDGCIDGA